MANRNDLTERNLPKIRRDHAALKARIVRLEATQRKILSIVQHLVAILRSTAGR